MKTVTINIPEGKTATQEEVNGNIVIKFKDIPKNIIDRIKTYTDALAEASHETQRDCEIFPTDTDDVVAYKKQKLIAKVLRGDWVPNWNDSNERKWFPYFKWSAGSGFGFSCSYYLCDHANATVGSRLCFPSEELANYFGKQFIEIHNQILNIQP